MSCSAAERLNVFTSLLKIFAPVNNHILYQNKQTKKVD